MLDIAQVIANELNVKASQTQAAIRLLDEGATVPFIARYRKEVTQGLSDSHLRQLQQRLIYLRELAERKQAILQALTTQNQLTTSLKQAIEQADSKIRLEDLYLPYKPKRRTKAQIAIEAGLTSLAFDLLKHVELDPTIHAAQYLNPAKEITNTIQAIEGAKQILMAHFAEEPDLAAHLRDYFWQHALLCSSVNKNKKEQAKKFSDYFDYQEAIKKIPSHRALALFRGRREGFLSLKISLPEDKQTYPIEKIIQHFSLNLTNTPRDRLIQGAVDYAYKVKLESKLELELFTQLKEKAEEAAIDVFAANLKDLLLLSPAGEKITIGLDPGIRTGIKTVVVDSTGKLLDETTLFPLAPHNDWHGSIAELAKLAGKYQVELISIGNGTGSRETEKLVSELISTYPDLKLKKIMINEAGASVYSASEIAEKEFPDLDVSLRGAVSIARRLQDPLAELVKIEPKSIGVGQYQHDVNQVKLARTLDGVVEDCVNAVGVDVNTASNALLKHVAGLSESVANNLVQYRDEHGKFTNREALKAVPRMGEATFEQAAGFLRIREGDTPLDNTAVHPEAYPVIEKILEKTKKTMQEIISNSTLLEALNAADFVDEQFGLPTIKDILNELRKPGRDPRGEFKTATFKEGVESISQLELDMVLEGVVTNVTNFGAFIDVGVHQDGLVHISEMTNQFINDPRKVVKTGDIVKVRVIEVDKGRKRIGLSMKLTKSDSKESAPKKDKVITKPQKMKNTVIKKNQKKPNIKKEKPIFNTAMADALSKLKQD